MSKLVITAWSDILVCMHAQSQSAMYHGHAHVVEGLEETVTTIFISHNSLLNYTAVVAV